MKLAATIVTIILLLLPVAMAQPIPPSLEVTTWQFAPSLLLSLPGICACLNTTAPRGVYIMVAVRSNNTSIVAMTVEYEMVVTLADGKSLVSRAARDLENPTTVMVVLVPEGSAAVASRRVSAVVESVAF